MKFLKRITLAGLLLSTGFLPGTSVACGGFFCQLIPINQAAEQIVFRQDGNQVTAMVQIQFVGNPSDFSWVVPVPSTPEFELGSNTAFNDLELATRPQFNLEQTGSGCFIDDIVFSPVGTDADGTAESSSGGVVVESTQDVGGYTVTLISGDNAESISQWLADNNFDLTSQGAELLAPYIEEQMKFVAVRLQQDRGTGSIQPLILKYESDKPVIPIRLTAVAALEDMGVLVWLLGDARAVPENFLHVTPNYTRLNWFAGPQNAYASYQSLITEAMNEAGGQGFATDYAGRFDNLLASLSSPSDLESQLARITGSSDVEYLSLVQNIINNAVVSDTIAVSLPLQNGQSPSLYFDQNFLATNFTAAELASARSAVDTVIRDEVIAPLQASLDVLGGNRYLTRLFTTLSADEMTLDPEFVFNPDMGDQQLDRNATLNINCIDDREHWTLKLGEGTGRDDEVVIDTIGSVPFFAPPITQEASWKLEDTSAFGQPEVLEQRAFQVATLGSPGTGVVDTGDNSGTDGSESGGSSGEIITGGSGGGAFGLSMLLLFVNRRRRH